MSTLTPSMTMAVGDELTTPGRTITETDLVSFASLTGDWHPQHADAEWARSGRFGERVAHGMMIVSYAVGLMPFDPGRVVALRGLDSVTFKRPVRNGDTIRVRSRVASSRPLEDGLELVSLSWRIVNQDDRAVARATVEAVCRTEPASQNGARSGNGAGGAGIDEEPFDHSAELTDLYGDRVLL